MKESEWRSEQIKLALYLSYDQISEDLSLPLQPGGTYGCLCSQRTSVFAQGQAEEEANMSQTTVPPSGGRHLCISPDSTSSDLSQA